MGMGRVDCLRVPGTGRESVKEAESGAPRLVSVHPGECLAILNLAVVLPGRCRWSRSPWSPFLGLPHPNTFLSEVRAARCQGALGP